MTTLTMTRDDQERMRELLTEAVTVLCRNGLSYSSHVDIDGLLGITVDSQDVFLVKISETVDKSSDSHDLSHVSALLGAAQNNFGLALNSEGGAGALHGYSLSGGKDHNDNHQPAAINIAPLDTSSQANQSRYGRGKRVRIPTNLDEPLRKRPHVSPPALPETLGDVVVKSEPLDSDEDATPAPFGKTLGVISAVRGNEADFDSPDQQNSSDYNQDQPESQVNSISHYCEYKSKT